MRTLPLVVLLTALALPATAQAQYDESQNWLNAYGRTVEHFSAPDRSIGTALVSAENTLTALQQTGRVPDRGAQQTGAWPWSGDARRGSYGHRGPFTGKKVEVEFASSAADGHMLAATVYAPSDERIAELGVPTPLPGLVYAPGVTSSQPMYAWFAEDMADAGYTVMTYDLSGQGRSEGRQPADNPARDLRSALAFFLSTANPLRDVLDADRVGTAGHSLGAGAVQSVGSFGGVVKAISAHSDLGSSYAGDVPIQGQGADYETFILPPAPTPGASPTGKLAGFNAARARGVDAQEIVIESGTHMAWSHVTWAYTAAWSEAVALHYSLAWFDRYLHDDIRRTDGVPAADGLTGTERTTLDFDAVGDHGLSRKYRSAYALRDLAGGAPLVCDDMAVCD